MEKKAKEIVLVTGATGLVGSHILSLLIGTNVEIIAICRNLPAKQDNRIKWISCDLLDVSELNNIICQVDKIYHCAGLVSFQSDKTKELYKINVEGTANVVNAAIANKVKKIVHISSVAAIGEAKSMESVIQEDLVWEENAASYYGKSKHLAELELWRGVSEGLEAVVLNPSIILGCGDWTKGSTQIFKTIYEEFPWYSKGVHGFVDVMDVGKAAILAMESTINSQRFIINSINISYEELFKLIANNFNKRPPYKEITPLLSAFVWRFKYIKGIITGKPSILNRDTARTALANIQYDNSKFLKEFPEFKYKTMRDSVTRICSEIKNKYNLK